MGGALAGADLGSRGAGGLGYLLARQLVAAGELVLDVQPRLGARVRLLATGASNKNDPNDARSVAIAALRSAAPRPVASENHAAVLKLWSKRHRDLGRTRNQVACRLHAVLCELVPGGISKEITAGKATRILESAEPSGAVALARCELAAAFLDDLRRIDAQMRDTKKKLAAVVRASGTTLTEIFGVGPVIAATMIGYVADVSRFPSRDNFAAYNGTAPIEVSSGNRKIYRLSRRGNRRLNHAVHTAAVTQIRSATTTATATAAPATTASSPRARPPKKPSAASSGGSATPSTPACRPTPAGPQHSPGQRAREGNRGTTLSPARPAHTPKTSSSAKPLPSPPPPYDPRPDPHPPVRHQHRRKTGKALDTKRLRYGRQRTHRGGARNSRRADRSERPSDRRRMSGHADERGYRVRRMTRCDSGTGGRREAGRRYLSHQAGDVPAWPRCRTRNESSTPGQRTSR